MNENKTIPTTPIIGQIYTAVILSVYDQEQEANQDTSGWHRYRLVIDIADGDSKGYYGYNYNDFNGRQYNGVLDWYLPMDDYDANRYDIIANQIAQQQAADTVIQYNHNASYTSLGVPHITDTDRTYYYSHKRTIDNINTILCYNNIDTLPADLTGLLIPIKLSMRDGVMPIIDSWLPSVSAPAPSTADNDISHYTPIDSIENIILHTKQKLTDILHADKVKGRDIRVATPDGIAALRAKLQANNTQNLPAHTPQMPYKSSPYHITTPPSSTAPAPSPAAPAPSPEEVPTGVIVDDIVAALQQQQEQQQDDEKSASDRLQQALDLFADIDDTATRQQHQQQQDDFVSMFAPPPVASAKPKVRLCIVPDRPQYGNKVKKKK